MLLAGVAQPGPLIIGEELAVLQTMAAIVTQDSPRPFERLYYESEFEGAPFVTTSLQNPDRNFFCGLTRPQALAMVTELADATSRRVEFDEEIARPAGLKIARKKNPKLPYVILSRAVFGPNYQYAWVAVEMNGTSGAVMRLDKVGGEWKKTSRCGGWMKPEE